MFCIEERLIDKCLSEIEHNMIKVSFFSIQGDSELQKSHILYNIGRSDHPRFGEVLSANEAGQDSGWGMPWRGSQGINILNWD